MKNIENKSTSQNKSIKKYKLLFNSGAFGFFFATIAVMAIMISNMIVIVLFKLENSPEKIDQLINLISLLVFIVSFGIGLVYFTKYMNKEGKLQFHIKTILISFVICFIIYSIVFWVL